MALSIRAADHIIDIPQRKAPPITPKPEQQTTCQKVWAVVSLILKILAAIALCIFSPTVFLATFVIGLIIAKHVEKAMEKIKHVIKTYPWVAALVIGGFCLLGLQATLLVGTGLLGSHLGSLAYIAASKYKNNQKTT
jgi:hypothetical protein